jgi:hypothetical protein
VATLNYPFACSFTWHSFFTIGHDHTGLIERRTKNPAVAPDVSRAGGRSGKFWLFFAESA